MSTPPIVVRPSTSLADAQRLMEQRHVRRLPVIEHHQLVGIVSWGDLRAAQPSIATTLSIYEWRTLLERAHVAECMTRDPVTIAPDMTILDAARLMLDRKTRRSRTIADALAACGQILDIATRPAIQQRADWFD
jgi:CBS domain-containing protein